LRFLHIKLRAKTGDGTTQAQLC